MVTHPFEVCFETLLGCFYSSFSSGLIYPYYKARLIWGLFWMPSAQQNSPLKAVQNSNVSCSVWDLGMIEFTAPEYSSPNLAVATCAFVSGLWYSSMDSRKPVFRCLGLSLSLLVLYPANSSQFQLFKFWVVSSQLGRTTMLCSRSCRRARVYSVPPRRDPGHSPSLRNHSVLSLVQRLKTVFAHVRCPAFSVDSRRASLVTVIPP